MVYMREYLGADRQIFWSEVFSKNLNQSFWNGGQWFYTYTFGAIWWQRTVVGEYYFQDDFEQNIPVKFLERVI